MMRFVEICKLLSVSRYEYTCGISLSLHVALSSLTGLALKRADLGVLSNLSTHTEARSLHLPA